MAVAGVSSSSGVPSPYASGQALADSQSSSSGIVNSCGEEALATNPPKVIENRMPVRKGTVITTNSIRTLSLFTTENSDYAASVYVASHVSILNIKNGISRILILTPVWIGNPDCNSLEAVANVIANRRLFLSVEPLSGNGKMELLQNDCFSSADVQYISKVVVADMDTEQQLKSNVANVFDLISKNIKGSLVSSLSDKYTRQIDVKRYVAKNVSAIVEESFKKECTRFVDNSSSQQKILEERMAAQERQKEAEKFIKSQQIDDLARQVHISSICASSNGNGVIVPPQQAKIGANAIYRAQEDGTACTLQ